MVRVMVRIRLRVRFKERVLVRGRLRVRVRVRVSRGFQMYRSFVPTISRSRDNLSLISKKCNLNGKGDFAHRDFAQVYFEHKNFRTQICAQKVFLFLFRSILCAQVDLAQKRNCAQIKNLNSY